MIKNESYLKSQFVTSKIGRGGKQKQLLVLTENGVAVGPPAPVRADLELYEI